ncbi:hypothetical protein C9975_11410, partial [Thalassospira xiamenensis]
MDYDTRSDISTPWLRIFIIGNLLFVVTGLVILIPTFKRIARGRSQHRQPRRRRARITMRAIHKWTSMLLLAQVMIWGVTGFYFSWLGHQRLAAHDYFQRVPAEALPGRAMAAPTLTTAADAPWYRVGMQQVGGAVQWQVATATETRFYHTDGRPWQTDKVAAEKIAKASYTGAGSIAGVTLKAEGQD